MNTSRWIIGLTILAGIALGIWLTLSRMGGSIESPFPTRPDPKNIQTPMISPEDQAFIDAMKKSEEEREKKNEATTAGIGYFNEAMKAQDITLCEKIEIEEMQQNCKNQMTRAEASSKKDISLCDSLTGSSIDECRDSYYLSSALGQVSLTGGTNAEYAKSCEKIKDLDLKNTCTRKTETTLLEIKQSANGELSENDCEGFRESSVSEECKNRIIVQNDYKLLSEAGTSSDPKLCEKITDASLQVRCRDAQTFLQAKKTTNKNLCDDISSQSVADDCRKSIGAAEQKTLYLDAINAESPKLCDKLTDSTLKSTCLDRTRIKKIIEGKDPAQCDIIVDAALRESCVQTIKIMS